MAWRNHPILGHAVQMSGTKKSGYEYRVWADFDLAPYLGRAGTVAEAIQFMQKAEAQFDGESNLQLFIGASYEYEYGDNYAKLVATLSGWKSVSEADVEKSVAEYQKARSEAQTLSLQHAKRQLEFIKRDHPELLNG